MPPSSDHPSPQIRSSIPPVPLRPVDTLAPTTTHLPRPLTSLVGREQEIAVISDLITRPDVPLVTLTGTGGVGKTRLALAVSEAASDGFPGGTVFVALASLTDPDLVLPTIAQAFGLRESGDWNLADRLAAILADRQPLLVLDNLEQVAAAGPHLSALLSACPHLTILATSRVVLRLSGEHVVPVLPLATPDATQRADPVDIAATAAVSLFVQRATAANPAFTLTTDSAPVVAEIVRRLDGLPLAIELAAARVRALSPPALLARLDDRLRLLTGGARDQPARQRTMRDTIAWSYGLLSPDEKRFFQQLGVFAGGFTLDAAEAVVTGDDVVEGIASLVDNSLLRRDEHLTVLRYTMLETVRAYAREQLDASGDRDRTFRALACWLIDRSELTTYGYLTAESSDVLARLPAEIDNIRTALGWVIDSGETDLALHLVVSLARFWWYFGRIDERQQWFRQALALPGADLTAARSRAITCVAWAADRLEESIDARAMALHGMAIAEATGDLISIGWAHQALGGIAGDSGDFDEAQTRFERTLEIARLVGDRRWEYIVLKDFGTLAARRGDHARAIQLYEAARPIVRTLGHHELTAEVTIELAYALLQQRHWRRAAVLMREGLAQVSALVHPDHLALSLSDVTRLAIDYGRADPAARLLGALATLRSESGVPSAPPDVANRERMDVLLRSALDERAYAPPSRRAPLCQTRLPSPRLTPSSPS